MLFSHLQTRLPCKRWPHSIIQTATMQSIKLAGTTGSRLSARRDGERWPYRIIQTATMHSDLLEQQAAGG